MTGAREWLAEHVPVEEMERWGAVTVRALAEFIDHLTNQESNP